MDQGRLISAMKKGIALACLMASLSSCNDKDPDEQGGSVSTGSGESEAPENDSSGNGSTIRMPGGEVTMRTGPNVLPDLPADFTLFPEAEITEVTNISGNPQRSTLVAFTSEAGAEDMVAFYRAQAEAAGVRIDVDLESPHGHIIGGKSPDDLDFSFTATRAGQSTKGELMVRQRRPD